MTKHGDSYLSMEKYEVSPFPLPPPVSKCDPLANKVSDKSYKMYRCMVIETELTDENPSHWPSSIVPNTSLSVYLFGP